MKILYLVKEKASFTDTLKGIIDAQVSSGNEVSIINLYEENIDYDILVDKIFGHDKIICF